MSLPGHWFHPLLSFMDCLDTIVTLKILLWNLLYLSLLYTFALSPHGSSRHQRRKRSVFKAKKLYAPLLSFSDEWWLTWFVIHHLYAYDSHLCIANNELRNGKIFIRIKIFTCQFVSRDNANRIILWNTPLQAKWYYKI